MCQKLIDDYLVAWGASVRVNERTLKRPICPQSRYSVEASGAAIRQDAVDSVTVLGFKCEVQGDGAVQWYDPNARSNVRVRADEVKIAFKVMHGIDPVVKDWLFAHFAMAGTVQDKFTALGISESKYKRNVRDAKTVFGAQLWIRSRPGLVVQRGVMQKFDI